MGFTNGREQTASGPDGPGDGPSLAARLTANRFAPTILALALAIASLPLAVLSMVAADGLGPTDGSGHLGYDDALAGCVGAVIAGALVGGTLGGLFVRRRPLAGAFVALATAWPAAIVGFTLLPWYLGRTMSVGCVRLTGSCSTAALDLHPGGTYALTAASRYVESVWGGWLIVGMAVVYWIVPLVVAIVVATRIRPGRGRIVAFATAVLAHGAVHSWSIAASSWAWVVLVGGVVTWVTLLSWPNVAMALIRRVDGASDPELDVGGT